MARAPLTALLAFGGVALALTAPGAASRAPLYTFAATQACLTKLPNTVAGLPPAKPPVSRVLFVYALAHDDVSTASGIGPRPRAHRQLGVWSGSRSYEGVLLSFFKSRRDARASLKTLVSLYGGKLVRNVVVTWAQQSTPSRSMRNTVLRCLRSGTAQATPKRTPPAANLATFAGRWGGHTRGLSITPTGRGREVADDGCCTRVYRLGLEILSVSGTLTRASAVYRVTSFRRHESGVRRLRAGDVGRLRLRNGIVTNTLTHVFFCSGPAWGATGACGA
ncbi:MAG: hypothetical protein ACJ75G_11390 [Gaiellaceae bacterium]